MTDFLVKGVPLPIPRPEMEEVHPVLEVGEKLNFPLPELNDLDLTYPLVGLDWVKSITIDVVLYPWTYTKGKTMELLAQLNSLQSQLNTGYLPDNYNYGGHDVWPFLMVIASVVIIGYVICNISSYVIDKLWKKK
jgi:hypothetical protein